jgi:hypothetical protein
MIVEKHFMASGKHSMAAVSRRLARADGVSIVLEYAKRYDTCSEARTAPRVGCTCLAEASACFAYDMRQRGSAGTRRRAAAPAFLDDRTQWGALMSTECDCQQSDVCGKLAGSQQRATASR